MSAMTLSFCAFGIILMIGLILISASIRIVPEYKRLDVYRLGRYIGKKGPGLVLLIPIIDRGILNELGSVEMNPGQKRVGVWGQTRTTVYTDGKVLLANSEEWDAISQKPISAGQRVRVVRMIVEVEAEPL